MKNAAKIPNITIISGIIFIYNGSIKNDDLIGGNHDISLPHEIDIVDNNSIGIITFFSSNRLNHGAINVGPHMVVSENRIE